MNFYISIMFLKQILLCFRVTMSLRAVTVLSVSFSQVLQHLLHKSFSFKNLWATQKISLVV